MFLRSRRNFLASAFPVAIQALQIGAELRRALVAQSAIFLQRLLYNFIELAGNGRIELRGRRRSALENGMKNQRGSIALERKAASAHLIEHGSQGKKVGTRIQNLAADLFRRHIGHGSES